MKNILTIIPARSGSKGIPNKNIRKLNDKPLLAWSIEQAQQTEYYKNMKIIVSTDSEKYKEIALKWGAEVPFLRPKELSKYLSTDYEFINHALNWLKENKKYTPDIILQLRPTSPYRKIEDINKCLKIFIENINDFDSLRTVVPFEKSPYKMYTVDGTYLKPLFNQVNSIKEPFNQCRQKLPQAYLHNGYIDIYKTSVIKNGILSGKKIYPYIMSKNDTIDIDTEEDWKKAELFLS